MSTEAVLDGAFEILLAKARQRLDEQIRPHPATLNFGFGGGGVALTTSVDPVLLEIPWPGEIFWAHMYAGAANGTPVAVTATIDVQITRVTTFGSSLALYGGAIPTLTADSAANLNVSTWVKNLLPGDALIARLASFSGAATWITLNMLLYPTQDDLGSFEVIDTAGNLLTDSSSSTLTLRT